MKPKKVLHIITVSFVINHFFGRQFAYLREKTGNTYYLGCSPSSELDLLSRELDYIPFEVEITRNISPIADLKAIFKLYRFIKANEIDVVVGHTPKGGMVAMLSAFLAGIKDRIYFRHGIIYETSTGIKRLLLKNIDRLSGLLAKSVVCVSDGVKSISERDHLNKSEKNVIIGKGTCNGIDTEERFNPSFVDNTALAALRKQYNIEPNDMVLGYVGRLVRDKGINELVEAWALLKKNYSNIKLLLVGPIEQRDEISPNSIKLIETDPSIINTGFVLDSSLFFKLMNVFILPTYREGFPTVSLEASSMEVPVIITRATGCRESIIEGETGVFITHDVDDIVAKVSLYFDNVDLRKKHGWNGRNFVRQYFKQQHVWDEINQKLNY